MLLSSSKKCILKIDKSVYNIFINNFHKKNKSLEVDPSQIMQKDIQVERPIKIVIMTKTKTNILQNTLLKEQERED